VITLKNVESFYGRVHALRGVSLEVRQGEIVCLVGANGAGKTTVLNTISGLLHPARGQVLFGDRSIERMPPHEIVGLGVAQVPEGRKIFTNMTVLENLELGAFQVRNAAVIRERLDRVFDLFPRIKERRRQLGGTLSGGEQQMLAIARGLMCSPKLLLLDEPSLGLAPLIVRHMVEAVQAINQQGTTVLLVEQNARMALRVSHRGYVLETGRVVLTDQSSALLDNDQVRKAYLGL
jgi:branched-chain amino acid transport system ATP-binding protein